MKNGKSEIKGIYTVCNCKIFRIVKMKNKILIYDIDNNHI